VKKIKSLIKKLARQLGVFEVMRSCNIYLNQLAGSVHDPEYYSLPSDINGFLILDVGANLGQSIISFRKIFPQSNIV
jgi:hypothetical protein